MIAYGMFSQTINTQKLHSYFTQFFVLLVQQCDCWQRSPGVRLVVIQCNTTFTKAQLFSHWMHW